MLGKALTAILLIAAPALAADDDVVFRAMRDELARSMKKLQLENLQKPYFISYRVTDSDSCGATASFGAILTSSCREAVAGETRSRNLSIEVRVGDYARDNTNFYAFRMGAAGVTHYFATAGMSVPIEDNYDEIRRQLWLATDSGYKQALDVYSKKKAALEHRTRTEDAPDFSKEAGVNDTETWPRIELKRDDVRARAKEWSALFRQYPEIENSDVHIGSTNWLVRYVNSEGSSYTRQYSYVAVNVSADTQAVDGMPLVDDEAIWARSSAELPSNDEIAKRIRDLAGRLTRLRAAPLVERYNGPVLFEGQAAGEMVLQSLAPALVGNPRVVVDDTRFERAFASQEGSLADKLGGRVLPEFLTLTDDPVARQFHGLTLQNGYQVDEDGVKARPTVLVDRGILKTLLRTRSLIPGTTQSTGSRRGGGPRPSNLVLTSDKALSSQQVKAELIGMATQRGREFGIVVRRMNNPELAQAGFAGRTIIFTGRAGGAIEVAPLVEAYKVFPDGHEELVRNLEVQGLTLGAFKDIVAVSDSPVAYTAPVRINRTAPMISGGSYSPGPTRVTVVTPALLFDELTLQQPTGDIPNPPFTKHPFFDKGN